MIAFLAQTQNKFEGSTKVLYKFEGNKTNYGPQSVTLTENGTINEQTIIIPQAKGLYCAYPLDGSHSYSPNSFVTMLAGKTDWSIDCLFQSTSLSAINYIWSYVRFGVAEAHFSVRTDGRVGLGLDGQTIRTVAGVITTGTWYHIMVRQSTGKTPEIWVNGAKQTLDIANQYGWDGSLGDGPIGAYRLGGGQTFYLKNFRICIPSMKAPRTI